MAGLANNLNGAIPALSGQDKDKTPLFELARGILVGAVAGLVGAGTLRPADPVALLVASLLAGWLGDTYITRLANQMVDQQADEAARRVSGVVGGEGPSRSPDVTATSPQPSAAFTQTAVALDLPIESPEDAERVLHSVEVIEDLQEAISTLDELIATAATEEERAHYRMLKDRLLESDQKEGGA